MTSKPITIRGTRFPSMVAAARFYKIDISNVRARLNKGFSLDDAFTAQKHFGPPPSDYCRRGHLKTGRNLILVPNKEGKPYRACRECKNYSARLRNHKEFEP